MGSLPTAARPGGLVRAGVDLVEVASVAAALERFGARYARRCYSAGERAAARGTGAVEAAALAARFAAKEATIKVLEPGKDVVPPGWRDIEVVRLASGACRIALHARAASLAAREGIGAMAVSLSHEGPFACAVVVAVCGEPGREVPASGAAEPNGWNVQQGDRAMEEDIRSILAEHGRLPVDTRTLDAGADLYQVGLTSHASVSVMLALEEHFDLEFPPEMLRKRTFASVRSIEEALTSLLVARA